jgi:ABC-2 type transport system permease protein
MKYSSRARIVNIMMKEWRGTFSTASTSLMVTLLPLVIVAQVLVIIYLVVHFVPADAIASSILGNGLSQLQESMPTLGTLFAKDQVQVYFLLQLPIYLLLIPMMVSNILCTFSIVEEKQTRTLEPLLATPVRTWELLLAKALAGSLPAFIMAWVSAGFVLLGVAIMGSGSLLVFLLTPYWLVSLLLVTPLVTLLSFLLGIIGSSRATDPRSAQVWALPMVLPLLGWVAVQVLGYIPLTMSALLVAALIIAAAVILLL